MAYPTYNELCGLHYFPTFGQFTEGAWILMSADRYVERIMNHIYFAYQTGSIDWMTFDESVAAMNTL